MPDDMREGDPKKYSALSQMSTADLKRLFVRELDALDDEAPDIAFVDAIMEVINEREAGTTETEVDTETAWQDLQERIANRSEDGAPILPEMESKRPSGTKRPRYLRVLRSAAAVAIVFLAVCGTASAFGVNVFQTVAQWTTDTFHFASQTNIGSVQEDPYAELRSAVAELTDVPVIPTWAPEGTSMEQDVRVMAYSDDTFLLTKFRTERGEFSVSIQVYNERPSGYTATYQKDDSEVVIVDAGGVSHYIVHNNAKCGAIWMNGLVEISIEGDLTEAELEKMVRSIYE